MSILVFSMGVLMLVFGVAGLSSISRKRFRRRNLAGVEAFAGYGKLMTRKSRDTKVEILCRCLLGFGLLAAVIGYIGF